MSEDKTIEKGKFLFETLKHFTTLSTGIILILSALSSLAKTSLPEINLVEILVCLLISTFLSISGMLAFATGTNMLDMPTGTKVSYAFGYLSFIFLALSLIILVQSVLGISN